MSNYPEYVPIAAFGQLHTRDRPLAGESAPDTPVIGPGRRPPIWPVIILSQRMGNP
jgi:hypothetical protein